MIAYPLLATGMAQVPEIPPQAVDIAVGFFMMIAAIALGIPIIRIIGRRLERGPVNPTVPAELTARLDRIEQGVDAMAIEIERISEGQRFTTKLLADQQRLVAKAEGAPPAKAPTDATS